MSPSASPTGESALKKRIKRHVIGRTHPFFAVTAPGLESLCLKELSVPPLSSRSGRAVTGGVEFTGRLPDCYLANLMLRTATRILMRIGTVEAARFDQLEKGLKEIPWELHLPSPGSVSVHAATTRCRLYHKEAIAERIESSIAERFAEIGVGSDSKPGAPVPQRLFVRGVSDRFLISIDSSGDILHKRSIKTRVGAAPLRETLAAAALMWAGYTGAKPLIDPMCGSGTFTLEAALMSARIPPGGFREFAFTGWPAFRPERWAHIRREALKTVRRQSLQPIFASDRDESLCTALRETTTAQGWQDFITVAHRDFFDFSPRELTHQTGWVALNPPYGRRIGGARESDRLFESILKQLRREYRGWKVVLIAPDRDSVRSIGFPVTTRALFHGGLTVYLTIGSIP